MWITLLAIAFATGAFLGWLCARVIFVGSALAIIPWAIAGLLLGWFASGWRFALVGGAVYGFALGVTFMVAGYEGSRPLSTALLLFAVIGLICAACGLACAVVGHGLRRLTRRRLPG
jgi:hypothetical protein